MPKKHPDIFVNISIIEGKVNIETNLNTKKLEGRLAICSILADSMMAISDITQARKEPSKQG